MPQSPLLSIPIIRLKEASSINFLSGQDNQASLCLVYAVDQDTKVCQDFLEKVLKAVELDIKTQTGQFKLQSEDRFSLIQHLAYKQFDLWISFGIAPERLGLNFEHQKYQSLNFQDKTFLWVDAPQTIMEDPNLKKLLWVSLQQLFPKNND